MILIENFLLWKICLLMPLPSARTKYFLSRTIFKLSRTKILSRVKKSIFCFEKSFKIKFLVERTLKIYFQLEIFIMHGFWKQKIDFLTLDKIFVLDNLNIVQDKKYCVQADGQGITLKKIKHKKVKKKNNFHFLKMNHKDFHTEIYTLFLVELNRTSFLSLWFR